MRDSSSSNCSSSHWRPFGQSTSKFSSFFSFSSFLDRLATTSSGGLGWLPLPLPLPERESLCVSMQSAVSCRESKCSAAPTHVAIQPVSTRGRKRGSLLFPTVLLPLGPFSTSCRWLPLGFPVFSLTHSLSSQQQQRA